jgi:hypothetical protein
MVVDESGLSRYSTACVDGTPNAHDVPTAVNDSGTTRAQRGEETEELLCGARPTWRPQGKSSSTLIHLGKRTTEDRAEREYVNTHGVHSSRRAMRPVTRRRQLGHMWCNGVVIATIFVFYGRYDFVGAYCLTCHTSRVPLRAAEYM